MNTSVEVGENQYDWERELNHGHDKWQDITVEAQARFLENVYDYGRRFRPGAAGGGVFYDDDPVGSNVEFKFNGDHTELARNSVAYVRGAFAWRPSALFPG